jgi:hypothetical protein
MTKSSSFIDIVIGYNNKLITSTLEYLLKIHYLRKLI